MHRRGSGQPLSASSKGPTPKQGALVCPQLVGQRRRATPPGAASSHRPQVEDARQVHDTALGAQHLCGRIDAPDCLHRGVRVRLPHQVCLVQEHHIRVGHLQLRQLAGGVVKQELLDVGGVHNGDHPVQHRPRLQRIVRPQGLDHRAWVRQACCMAEARQPAGGRNASSDGAAMPGHPTRLSSPPVCNRTCPASQAGPPASVGSWESGPLQVSCRHRRRGRGGGHSIPHAPVLDGAAYAPIGQLHKLLNQRSPAAATSVCVSRPVLPSLVRETDFRLTRRCLAPASAPVQR